MGINLISKRNFLSACLFLLNFTFIDLKSKEFKNEIIDFPATESIKKGDQSQNILLRDGDDVFTSKSEKTLLDQLNAVIKSNLTPSNITVFINGNIKKSGRLEITQGVSLYEAIAASGEMSLSGQVELIRLSDSGDNEKRFFSYNKTSPKGSYQNPILLSGDIITVRKSLLGKTNQAINQYGSPGIRSYALYKIFNQ